MEKRDGNVIKAKSVLKGGLLTTACLAVERQARVFFSGSKA